MLTNDFVASNDSLLATLRDQIAFHFLENSLETVRAFPLD